MADREKKMGRKTEYLEKEKSFIDEINSIFHKFWRAIIWWEIEIWQKIADTSFNWSKKSICKFKINNWPTESCGVEKRIRPKCILKEIAQGRPEKNVPGLSS